MDDAILRNINLLVAEEHDLLQQEHDTGHDPERHARLQLVEETLDQLWDLLRRRRAARRSGLDPDSVEPRDRSVVERYLQ